jgi:hypothetical protein
MPKIEKKDKFEELPDDFRSNVQSMKSDEIKGVVSKVALDQVELMKAKKEDQDLAEKREQYLNAGAVYKEGSKLNRTKIEFCKMVLDGMGK